MRVGCVSHSSFFVFVLLVCFRDSLLIAYWRMMGVRIDYAKMLKKRDKHPGEHIEIDMDTLRASTRAAAEREQRKAERERERDKLVAQKNASTLSGTVLENGNGVGPGPGPGAGPAPGLGENGVAGTGGLSVSPKSVHSTGYPGAYSVEPPPPPPPPSTALSMPSDAQSAGAASARSEPIATHGWGGSAERYHHFGGGGSADQQQQQHSYVRGPGLVHVRTASTS